MTEEFQWKTNLEVFSMTKNKKCPKFLRISIGGRLCKHYFRDVEIMPRSERGYDIVCNKGKKIDVKMSCATLKKNSKNQSFNFKIEKNKTADHFILIALDNGNDINILNLWIVPAHEINNKSNITTSIKTMHKWDKWKRDNVELKICQRVINDSKAFRKRLS